jgi:hypothetical protein
MGAIRRRANQLAAAEGQAAREVAADHANFAAEQQQQAKAGGGAAGAADRGPRGRGRAPPTPPQPWWVGYLTTLALSFAFWAFTRMLLRNQAWGAAHADPNR